MNHKFLKNNINIKYFSFLLCFSFFLTACSAKDTSDHSSPGMFSGTEESSEISEEFDSFLNELFCQEVSSNTINLHFTLSEPENFDITKYDISLGELTEEEFADENARNENYLHKLKTFDYNSLTTNQQLTYDILSDYLQLQLDAADLYLYDEPLRPSTGVQAQLPILFEEYNFYDEQDITDYLQLIALTDEYFDQVIAFEQKKADAGLFMSDFACNTIISQCRSFTANPDSHYLIETFNNRIDEFVNLSQEKRDAYKIENETIIKEQVLPAFDVLADSLAELLGSGTNDAGLCYFPKGKEYYEYLVYYSTGCSSSIKEIQDMITGERATVLKEASDLMNEDSELWKKCNDVSLDNTSPTMVLHQLQAAMTADFPEPPETDFTVSLIDECVADYLAPAFYITAPIDNYTSNSIFINGETDTSDLSYFTTLAHEGYPGHLYQTVMSYEAGLSPARCLLNYPGYVEGWATYVEMQSYYYAGLETNVAALLQKNQSALLSLYATTDLGIHYDGWTLDDTITFWENYGIGNENTITQIYELIVEEPAHYLKYYVGYLEFKELKESASRKHLGRLDNIAFHQAILDIGPAPFDIVEKYLDLYYKK